MASTPRSRCIHQTAPFSALLGSAELLLLYPLRAIRSNGWVTRWLGNQGVHTRENRCRVNVEGKDCLGLRIVPYLEALLQLHVFTKSTARRNCTVKKTLVWKNPSNAFEILGQLCWVHQREWLLCVLLQLVECTSPYQGVYPL